MFGWIHESFRQLINRKYGKDVWTKILALTNFEDGTECEVSKYYKDEDTSKLVNSMSTVVGVPIEELWEAYGSFLIQYTMETGWDELLQSMSPNLQGFLESLDSLHYFIDHVVYRTKLKGPSFRCELSDTNDDSLILHYYSCRLNLYPIVKGVIREVARRIYSTEITIKIQSRKQDDKSSSAKEHVVFLISPVENGSGVILRSSEQNTNISNEKFCNEMDSYPIVLSDFCNAFPHHFCFDKYLHIQHVGKQIQISYPFIMPGETRITELLELCHPQIPFNFESLMAFRNSTFIVRLKEISSSKKTEQNSESKVQITLKGSMHLLDGGKYMCYMCSLNVTTLQELIDRNLFISDIQRHDSTRDLIMLNQSRISQVELNKRLEETTRNLKKMANELESEKQRTEDLLCELMPLSVAESLRQGHSVEASEFNEATVLFTDIVTFTNICALCTPYDVVNLLNDLYLRFDRLTGLHNVYKVETIGDAYMLVGGVPNECANHAENVLNVSIGMLMESKRVLSPITHMPIRIRIGVHSGPVVAGVVGVKMPRYCLFGDTIYVANRMESNGVPGHIHVSETTKKLAAKTNDAFVFKDRGHVDIKGSGTMHTYFMEKNEKLSVWQICARDALADQSADGYSELHGDYSSSNGVTPNNNINNSNSKMENGNVAQEEVKRTHSKACHIL